MMQNKLAFNNFRRFPKFGPIEFGDITYLVGRNNSGKSTFVKAYMLMMNYIKSGQLDILDFNQNNVEDLNIVTYERAKCKSLNSADQSFIDFSLQLNNLTFYLKVTGNALQVQASVINFNITEENSGLSLKINPSQNFVNLQWEAKSSENDGATILNFEEIIRDKTAERAKIVDDLSEAYILLSSELENYRRELNSLKRQAREGSEQKKIYLSTHYASIDLPSLLNEIVVDFNSRYDVRFKENQELGGKPFKETTKQFEFESLRTYYQNASLIKKFIEAINDVVYNTQIKYLPATLNKQSALFSIRDQSNSLAQAVHEFQQLQIDKTEGDAKRFVLKWMKENKFEIGDNFDVQLIAGESYEYNIISNGISIPLADKGMGSIQSMLLILRIATIIYKKSKDSKKYILIIEEPELNLHPALQSRLCEMFYEAKQRFDINFIVETHSEYVVRKSQVFVNENDLQIAPNENPFSVIYFDKDINKETPIWNMIYNEDGSFKNSFGEGFFDTASSIALHLIKLRRNRATKS